MRKLTLTILILCASIISFAGIRLPYFFSDNMVLQQKSNPAIWGWAHPNAKISIHCSWNKKTYSAMTDAGGKWKTSMETPAAGGPFEINISGDGQLNIKNILIGEVWLCSGQSNMEMPMKGFRDQPVKHSNDEILLSENKNIRLFNMPHQAVLTVQDSIKSGVWNEANPETVSNFSATAYYFGKYLEQLLHVPIGLVAITYNGTPIEAFMDAKTLQGFPEIKILDPSTPKPTNKNATTVYNGMLHPFLGFGVRGTIWYQGETNYDRPAQYEQLFPAFVDMLRQQSNQPDMAFYYAQIAPFNYGIYANATTAPMNSAFLRDAQRKAASKIPNSGMAVLMDIGEENSIHPVNKEAGGKRLALLALAKSYGIKGIGYASPEFDSLSISGNIASIRFKSGTNGISSFGKTLSNFEIAGADKIFHPAKAIIAQGKVLVSAMDVPNPVAVRYAFKNVVEGDLFGTDGLPVSSFRTDDW